VSTIFDARIFSELMDMFPQYVGEWKEKKKAELLEILASAYADHQDGSVQASSGPAANDQALELAATVFKCSHCRLCTSYPGILTHGCLTINGPFGLTDERIQRIFNTLDCQPWNFGGKRVLVAKRVDEPYKGLVKACGFDPDVTTGRQMDEEGIYVECLRCTTSHTRVAFFWRLAVRLISSSSMC
jgi:hypothetical protein